MPSKLIPFAELEAQRASATQLAQGELEQLEARHRRELATATRDYAAKCSAAETAYAEALEANERIVAQGAQLALGPLVAEFDADPKAETARALAGKYRTLEAEAVRLLGRGFNSNFGNPLAVAIIKLQLRRMPEALVVFAYPGNWDASTTGLAYPLERALCVIQDVDSRRELLDALLDLLTRIQKIAKAPGVQRMASKEAASYWAVLCSGASHAGITAMLAELDRAADQRRTDASVEEQAIVARAKSGETIPGRSQAWHHAVRAVKRLVTYAGTGVASGLNAGGGRSGSTAGI